MEAFERLFARYQRITGKAFYPLPRRDRRAGDAAVAAAGDEVKALREKFLAAMDDDFNTAIGIATLFDFVRVVNKFIDQHALEAKKPAAELATLDAMMLVLRELTGTLGLFLKEPQAKAGGGPPEPPPPPEPPDPLWQAVAGAMTTAAKARASERVFMEGYALLPARRGSFNG
jgi:cysteinyl-tRNA synthetase